MSKRIVHSFLKYPQCSGLKLISNLACFTLSCIYIKRHKDFKAILYADKWTVDTMQKIGAPYDEFHIIAPPKYPHSNIYAYPKFIAMAQEPLGSIHIDGDVFIWGNNMESLLNFDGYDVICQNVETYTNMGAKWAWELARKECLKCIYPKWARRECISMFNCGVIGINNQKLKDEYFEMYWHMLEQYKTKHINNAGVPDIIFEQQFLMDYCKYNNYKVKFLLDEHDLVKSAKSIGYLHLIGDTKYSVNNIKSVIEKIHKENPEIYKKLKEVTKYIK